MSRRRKRGLICILSAIAVFLGAAVWAYMADVRTVESNSPLIKQHKQGIGQLTADREASQSFRVMENGFSGVSVMVSTFNKKPKTGSLVLRLTDEAGVEIAHGEWSASTLKNNAAVSLPLASPQADSQGKVFTLLASSDCTDQKGITLRCGPKDEAAADSGLILADGTADPDNQLYLIIRTASVKHGWMGALSFLLAALCFAGGLPLVIGKEKRHG